jgi:hypothetical protein
VPNPIMKRKGDHVIGRFSAPCAITVQGSRCGMGVGMRIGKVIKVAMVAIFCPKVNMLVIMLPLGEMVVQHWAKERHEKDINGNNYDKPMRKNHRIGPSVWGLSGISHLE